MPRLYAHLYGRGARLTQVAHERGIGFTVVRVWEDVDRKFERQLKNRKSSPRLCPICRGMALQMPLLPCQPAYVTSCSEAEADLHPGFVVDEAQLSLDDYSLEVRAAELEDSSLGWSELAEYIDEQEREWFVSVLRTAGDQGIDLEGELEDLQEGMEDESFWRSGC